MFSHLVTHTVVAINDNRQLPDNIRDCRGEPTSPLPAITYTRNGPLRHCERYFITAVSF